MRIALVLLFILYGHEVFAQKMDLEPGLYQGTAEIRMNGKPYNAQAELQKMMAAHSKSMSPEMLAKMNSNYKGMVQNKDPNNIQICLRDKDLKSEIFMNPKTANRTTCKHKKVKHTPQFVRALFECEDGVRGDVIVTVADKRNFNIRQTNSSARNGVDHKVETNTKLKWLSDTCTKESLDNTKAFGAGS